MPYNNPRQHQYTGSLENDIGAYAGEETVTSRNHHRDAQRLTNTPQPNRQQRTAQRQEEIEARVRQNRTTASARRRAYPPVNKSYRDKDADIDGNGDTWPPQGIRNAIRNTPGQ